MMNGRNIRTKLSKGAARRHVNAAAALLILLAGVSAGAQGQTTVGQGVLTLTASAGLALGQTLRVTVPDLAQPEEESADGRVRIRLSARAKGYDSRGGLIFETPEVDIPAGGFHSFDINRDDIAAAGEPRTGRLQVRVEIIISAASSQAASFQWGVGRGISSPTGVELIDNDSGKTTAMLLPAVQQVREAAARK